MSTRILEELKSNETGVAQVDEKTEVHEVDHVSVDRMLAEALGTDDSPKVHAWTKVAQSLLAAYDWISGPGMTDRERVQREVFETSAIRSYQGGI